MAEWNNVFIALFVKMTRVAAGRCCKGGVEEVTELVVLCVIKAPFFLVCNQTTEIFFVKSMDKKT